MGARQRVRDLVVGIFIDPKGVQKGSEDAERALDELRRDGGRDVDALADSTEDAFRRMQRASDRLRRDVDADQRDLRSDLKESGREIGSEFAQNVGQGLASGNIKDLATDTAGGLIAAFQGIPGPVGQSLALVATAATAVFASINSQAEASAQAITDAFDEIDRNLTGRAKRETALKQALGKDTYDQNLAEAAKYADKLFGGDLDKAVRYITEGNRGQRDLVSLQDTVNRLTQKNIDQGGELSVQDAQALRDAQDYLNAVNKRSDALRGGIQASERNATLEGQAADAVERKAKAQQQYEASVQRTNELLGAPIDKRIRISLDGLTEQERRILLKDSDFRVDVN